MEANLRQLAANDIDSALTYYRTEAGEHISVDFVDALEAAINHVCEQPLTGSLRFGYELDIPELRSWPLRKFPYLVFYIPDSDSIDIWRVLHIRRDIPVPASQHTLDNHIGWMEEALDQLELDELIFVGHDWGWPGWHGGARTVA